MNIIRERKRSRAYPGVNLPDSIVNLKAIYSSLGYGAHERSDLAKALGAERENGTTSRKLSALAMFGLIERTDAGYSISQLGKEILRPLPGEEVELRRTAFKKVALYLDVFSRYEDDTRLPEALGRILERSFEIVAPNGDYASRILLESGRYADLISESNEFVAKASSSDQSNDSDGSQKSSSMVVSDAPQKVAEGSPITLDATAELNILNNPYGVSKPSTSITLTKPFAEVRTSATLTASQKVRLESWIDEVVKPWIKYNVETDDQEEGDIKPP